MKKQVIGIFAAMVMCIGIGGFIYHDSSALADDELLVDIGNGMEAVDLSSSSAASSIFSYREMDMSGNSITISNSELLSLANGSEDGLKLNSDNGSIIMDKGYLASLLAQTQGDITFSLNVSGNAVYVSAKVDSSTIYGDAGICIVEADYGAGSIYTSVTDSNGRYVGTSCYYESGDVIRWQMTDSESYNIVTKEVVFNDIDNHWSKDYIGFLSSRDVVNGMRQGYFEPDGNLTRGQFITILARISSDNIEEYTTETFNDVSEKDYYYNAVCWANANNIVNGRSIGEFAPDAKITREEMAAMCWRYTDYMGLSIEAVRTPADFSDAASISSYAKDAVSQSYAAGYINGVGNNIFRPQGNATRAEAGTMISGLVSYITAMPH
ncbi:MAG: S-layer homology domain-containing protein [Bacillota bacterium]|nr:S-layer homology domain-containing protein [Bacillota bacterium]